MAQQLGIRTLAGCPFRNQGITSLHQAGAPGCPKAFVQSLQLLDHGVKQLIAVFQQKAQAFPFCTEFVQFPTQTFLLQACQSPQRHGQHGVGLSLAQFESHHQTRPGGGGILGLLDHGDHLLQVVQGVDQALHNLESVLGFAQGMTRAPDQRQFPVVQEGLKQLTQ